MAELCGSLPRRHRRRRSRRSRSRHPSRSRSANMVNAREEVAPQTLDIAKEVAKLRAEYDAVVTSSGDVTNGGRAENVAPVKNERGKNGSNRPSRQGSKNLDSGVTSSSVAGVTSQGGQKLCENKDSGVAASGCRTTRQESKDVNLEVMTSSSDRKSCTDPKTPQDKRGKGGFGVFPAEPNITTQSGYGDQKIPTAAFAVLPNSVPEKKTLPVGVTQNDANKVSETTSVLEACEDKFENKTENLVNPKTENTNQVKQCESFKMSVIDKNVPLVNGMSFRNALENRKEGPTKSVEVDEKKPPVMYSRKNSLLSEEPGARKNSSPKIEADWRQNSSRDSPSPRSDAASKDRRYSQSKERYFVRRNSLPREDSSRRNSFSRDEAFSRKNSFGKSDFVSRRNSLTKEEYQGRRNSVGRDEVFSRKNSFSKEESPFRRTSVPRVESQPKENQESSSRKSSVSDNAQFSRRNSLSRNEGLPKNDVVGRNRIVYPSKTVKNDANGTGVRKNSFKGPGQYSRRNSWSKNEFSLRNGESVENSQTPAEKISNDDETSFRKSTRPFKSDGGEFSRRSSWSRSEFPVKNLDEMSQSNAHEKSFDEREVSSRKNLISLNKDSFCVNSIPGSRNNSVSSEVTKGEKDAEMNSLKNISVEGENLPIALKLNASDSVSGKNVCGSQNVNVTEQSGVDSPKLGSNPVNTVESGPNIDVVNTKLSETSLECHRNSFNDFESEKVGSVSARGNPSSQSVNSALNTVSSTCSRDSLFGTGQDLICLPNETSLNSAVTNFSEDCEPKKASIESCQPRISETSEVCVLTKSESLNAGVTSENGSNKAEFFSNADYVEGNHSQTSSTSKILQEELSSKLPSPYSLCNGFDCIGAAAKTLEVNTNGSSVENAVCSPSLVEVCKNICKEFSPAPKSSFSCTGSIPEGPKGELAQWTPTNPVGRRKYSKEFIHSLADLPQCRVPPNLPKAVKPHVEKLPGGSGGSGGGPSMYHSKVDGLYPFSKGNSSPRISSHGGAYAFPSITKRSSQSRNMKPTKIQVSLSLNEDVKLKETENAWKPKPLAKNVPEKSSEEKEKEDLYNKVRSILNKLTPQKLNTLVSQITDLPINTPDRLAGVVNLIINKAIDEPNFSEAYAKMCKILSTSKSINFERENADKNQTDFRRVLLNCCQKQFELREAVEAEYKEKVATEQRECTEPEKLKELKFQHAEEERKIRMKAAGHCRFIGELFKLDMLKTSIMHYCITYLLKRTEEEPLESLCKLLTTIGKHYESRLETRAQALDPIMDELAKLASKNNKRRRNAVQISSRIRFMIQDILDLRMNNWVPRREENTPKTIDQIQKEADREQLETNIAIANTSMKRLDRPRMDDRKKSGHFNMGPDDWQTPKNAFKTPSAFKTGTYSIDTSKFENFKNVEPLESMRLGMARPNIWASGAATSKAQPEPPRNKFAAGNQFALLEGHDNQFPLNNAANSKSSTMDRDKSRDSRNISQDDEMLQKRGPAMGPPAREGSVMRSAPSSIQPPPQVPAAPALDDETMKKVVRSTLDEFIGVKDIKDVEYILSKKFVTPACLGKFVDAFIEYFLEKRKDQEVIAPVLGNLLDTKFSHFTPQLLVERFADFLSMAEDLIIDYPKLWDYMAMIIGYTLMSEHFNFDHVRQSCKSILRTDNSKKVLALVFKVITSVKTPVWISNKWNSSNVNLKDFIADKDIDEFIKTNKLEYLSDPNAPILKSSTPTLTFDEIKTKLLQILRDHPKDALEPVRNWVNENWGTGDYNHTLIRPLMTAICEASIIGPGEKNQFNKDALEKYFNLIRYYVDYNPNLEAHCLMAISMLMEKLQHPKGLALHFFQNLMEHTMSLEGFKRFHTGGTEIDPPENSEENRIRGIVVLGTRSFWVSVHENLDNSDDEGTS